MKKIALIAGSGEFPIMFAKAARARSVEIVAVAIKEETESGLEAEVDKIKWFDVGELGGVIDFLKSEDIKFALMAGKVRLSHIYSKAVSPDSSFKGLLLKAADKRGDTLLKAVASYLGKRGIKLINCATFLEQEIARKGNLTAKAPTQEQRQDIKFAKPLAKKIAGLKIGQSVAVKDKAVVAVEAMEGTDEMINRAGEIARGGLAIVKMTSPKHDMRFDIPLVGPSTIEAMKQAGADVLAVEANRTLLIERERFLQLANEAGISVVAV